MIDYLIVGAGLFGSVVAHEMKQHGFDVAVIDKRNHIGGNCYTENKSGITVHSYGPHIFHTDDKRIWEYINQFDRFRSFTNAPIAFYGDEVYNLPFNLNTFTKLFGVQTPAQALKAIEKDKCHFDAPSNLEEKALSLVGKTIYEKLIKGYTEKQWGKKCTELPPDIITRLPLRFRFDNNYFNDEYQGIPVHGYTSIFEKMLEGIPVSLNTMYTDLFRRTARKIVYTGKIDEFYWYRFGKLEYRSLKFVTEEIASTSSYQGTAVVNYTSSDIPWTRIIEHKYFSRDTYDTQNTIITREYPAVYDGTNEPYYPINTEINNSLYRKYRKLADSDKQMVFGGRTADYKYYDMDDTILQALKTVDVLLKGE